MIIKNKGHVFSLYHILLIYSYFMIKSLASHLVCGRDALAGFLFFFL